MPASVLVTGCSSGLGKALCLELASRVKSRSLYDVYATSIRFRCPEIYSQDESTQCRPRQVCLYTEKCDTLEQSYAAICFEGMTHIFTLLFNPTL